MATPLEIEVEAKVRRLLAGIIEVADLAARLTVEEQERIGERIADELEAAEQAMTRAGII